MFYYVFYVISVLFPSFFHILDPLNSKTAKSYKSIDMAL